MNLRQYVVDRRPTVCFEAHARRRYGAWMDERVVDDDAAQRGANLEAIEKSLAT